MDACSRFIFYLRLEPGGIGMTIERAIMCWIVRIDMIIENYILPVSLLLLGVVGICIFRWGIRRWLRRKALSRRS